MVRIKNILIIFLILTVIFSVNMVSANEFNVTDNLECSDDFSLEVMDESNPDLNSSEQVDEGLCSSTRDNSDENYVIYVGANNGDGNGSFENPFSTFDLACQDISTGKNNVTINVLEGNYLLNDLTFNCSNLHINGFGNVVIKNGEGDKHGFDLVSNQSTFVLSNIIIDYSDWTVTSDMYTGKYFYICKGNPNCTIFNNCTFLSYYGPILVSYNNQEGTINIRDKYYFFNNCNFIATTVFARMPAMMTNYVTFKNCMFSWNVSTVTTFSNKVSARTNTPIFEDCWFGVNKLPNQFYNKGVFLGYDINRYAMFSISETFLGDNTYEIIGKLSWNDTTTDGIENFNPMLVNLKSTTGDIPTTAILKNGTFKVIYTSTESNHNITATLDNEIQTIEFQSINVALDAPSITYGDNQNITVTLPDQYNGVITVIVNNKTYIQQVEYTNVVTINITDVLPVGTHDVNVNFVDKIDNETCAIYGFNTTKIIVNKVIPNVNISYEGELVPGEKLIVKVEVPYATENITIIVNGDKNTTKLVDNAATYTIDELAQGTYYVTVLYTGDEICDFAYATDLFDVVKSTDDLINELNKNLTAKDSEIDELNKNLTAKDSEIDELNKNLTAKDSEISELNQNITAKDAEITNLNNNLTEKDNIIAGKDAEISILNDNVKNMNNTIESQAKEINNLNATVIAQNKTMEKSLNPVATSILVGNISTTATTAKYFIISLVDANNVPLVNKTIQFTVNGKTNSVITNGSGVATVKANYSTAGTRYYTFSFFGENGYSASIASAKVVVNKKATKLTAPKKTFKATTKTKKVQVKLTTGKTVLKNKKVTLKVKGKTYTAKTNKKGIATFKITKLTKKGTFKYNVKFAGDKAYKAVNKNGKITIK